MYQLTTMYKNLVSALDRESLDLPVIIDKEGSEYVCHAVLTGFFDTSWQWFVFGYVDELTSGETTILYGLVTGTRNTVGTFRMESLVFMNCSIITDRVIMERTKLPEGWQWQR